MRYIPYLILTIFLVISCAPKKEIIMVKENNTHTEKGSTSTLQPADTQPQPDTTTYFKFTPDTLGVQKKPQKPEVSGEQNKEHVFRVQIFAFSTKDRAEKAFKEAREILSLPVYIEYDPSIDGPYKVRVGDFTSKEEAEKYKEKLRQEGYPDAFVVETEINR